MSKTLTLNLDSLWEDSYIYTEYDIGGSDHSITIKEEDKEAFLDAFAQEWRDRAEEALEEDEDDEEERGQKWCDHYNCWCSDVEEITDGQYACDLDCNDCNNLEYVK
jgi:hypothetical protein